jgi:hypothetical protein
MQQQPTSRRKHPQNVSFGFLERSFPKVEYISDEQQLVRLYRLTDNFLQFSIENNLPQTRFWLDRMTEMQKQFLVLHNVGETP